MAPKNKFKREEIVDAALKLVQEKGIDSLTAREVAGALNVSTGPIFTYFSTMDELKHEVFEQAKKCYKSYIKRGLKEKIPFLGVGKEYINFAKTEKNLYKMLFLRKTETDGESAIDNLRFTQDLVRESIMKIYNIDAFKADCYFRNMWLVSYAFATLVVTDEHAFTDAEMSAVMTEMSLCVCKAYKEIPGLPEGEFDKDFIFGELVKK